MGEPTWLGDYGQRIKLTIDGSKIEGDLTDFPVMVTLSSGVGLTNADVTDVFDKLDYAFSPDDTFSGINGNPPDTTRWLTQSSAGGAAQINDNMLRMSAGTGATNYAHSYSRFKVMGDFDIRVDFDNFSAPATNYTWASLSVSTDEPDWANKHRVILYRSYAGAHAYEYQTYDGSYHTEASPATSDTTGKLRITRSGSTWTAYYWNSGWVSLGDSAYLNKTGPVFVRLRIENGGSNPACSIDWDNFEVASGTVIWGNDENYVSNFPNRKKIAITTASGVDQCYVEIERWEQHNELAHLWFKAPTLASGVDSTFYLYYDASQADNSTYVGDLAETAARNVWDSNFKMVHHMGKWPSVNQSDSTANAQNTTASNAFEDADQVDGLVGKAISADGSAEGFDLPTTGTLEVSPFTLEVLVQKDSQAADSSLIAYQPKGANAYGLGWLIRCDSSDIPYCLKGSNDGSWESVWATTAIDNSEYHHIAVRFQATTLFDILINGTIEDSETDPGELTDVNYTDHPSSTNPPTKQSRIFCSVDSSGNDRDFADGKIDEIRVSNTVRSQAWLRATNYTARDTLLSYDAPQDQHVFSFSGTVLVQGSPAARTVYLFRRSTGELVGSAESSAVDGSFIIGSPYYEYHFVVILPVIGEGYDLISDDAIHPGV